MRTKNLHPSVPFHSLCYSILNFEDKLSRDMVFKFLIGDMKNTKNGKEKRDILKHFIREFANHLGDHSHLLSAKKMTEIGIHLYSRGVCEEDWMVNAIAEACHSPSHRVSLTAIHFFLNLPITLPDNEEEERKARARGGHFTGKTVEVNYHQHSKRTKKRQRETKRQLKHNKKVRRRMAEENFGSYDIDELLEEEEDEEDDNESKEEKTLFHPSLHQIHNPFHIVEKVFQRVKSPKDAFEVRLTKMKFISYTISAHELIFPPYYSFLQRYLRPPVHESATSLLSFLVTACHTNTPPSLINPIMRTIVNTFVNDGSSGVEISVGINSIRAILQKTPSLLTDDLRSLEEEEDDSDDEGKDDNYSEATTTENQEDGEKKKRKRKINKDQMIDNMEGFIQDLVAYGKDKRWRVEKGVTSACNSLTNYVQQMAPQLLKSKDRAGMRVALGDTAASSSSSSSGVKGQWLLEMFNQNQVSFTDIEERGERHEIISFYSNDSTMKEEDSEDENEESDEEDQEKEEEESEDEDQEDKEEESSDQDSGEIALLLTNKDFSLISRLLEGLKRSLLLPNSHEHSPTHLPQEITTKILQTLLPQSGDSTNNQTITEDDLIGVLSHKKASKLERMKKAAEGKDDFQHKVGRF